MGTLRRAMPAPGRPHAAAVAAAGRWIDPDLDAAVAGGRHPIQDTTTPFLFEQVLWSLGPRVERVT